MDLARLRALQQDEYDDLAAFLRALPADEWHRPSLCTGWTIRDVVVHIVGWDELLVYRSLGEHVRSLATLLARFVGARFSVHRMNATILARGARLSTGELLDVVDAPDAGKAKRIFDRMAPGSALAECVVHHQDMRRALGAPRRIPDDRLVEALGNIHRLPGVDVKHRARGLRLRATDVDWSTGHGEEVAGPGEAVLMALAGRAEALEDLTGPGGEVLAERLAR